ncbi:MAG: sulfatase-like hydrolase/transferase [Anaerolineae bacterium]
MSKPNILLIQSDQHRYDCSGFSGHPVVQTPTLDRLASQGVRFTHAFSPSPICCPARQSLMCGKWPEVHGGLWNFDHGLPLREFTEPIWGEALARAGYQLGVVGKWHVHPRRSPLDYGYHDFVSPGAYATWRLGEGLPGVVYDGSVPWMGGVDPVAVEQAAPHWQAAQVIRLIETYQRQERPWHVALNFDGPHLPCTPSGPFAGMYDAKDMPRWGSFDDTFENKPYIQRQQLVSWGIEDLGWVDWARYVVRYLGMVSQIDDAVGQVLAALDALGLAEDTLVVYTADHGDNGGSHRMIDKHNVMYDDVVRIPLLVRWPGMADSGRVCDAFVVNALDLASTACEAAGLPVPPDYQGRSLLPLLSGGTPEDWRRDAVATYNGSQFGPFAQRMLRDRRFKYVWNPTDVDELYDLANDPWELTNLINRPEHASTLQDMRLRLLTQLQEHGDGLVDSDWPRNQLKYGRKLGTRGRNTA